MELIRESLSDSDIMNFFDNKIKIVKYSEIKNMQSVDDLLQPFLRCIILFEITGFNNGHWTLLQQCYDEKKDKPYILFFDSYGYKPENELDIVKSQINQELNQKRGYLLRILYEQPQEIHYNNYRLQKLLPNYNTCGKWCCVKGMYPFINEHEFAELMRSTSSNKSGPASLANIEPDLLVCLLYKNLSRYNI